MNATSPGRLVLLGHPVAHSLSPHFQGAALRAAGIPLRYEALDVESSQLDTLLPQLQKEHAAGNVTVPHKVAVFDRCGRLSDLAKRVGAVNTFWYEGDVLVGDNTDVDGFEALTESLGIVRGNARVALIGAGGAARAVCAAVERWQGGAIRVWSRRGESARALQRQFRATVFAASSMADAIAGSTVVVNASPIGMRDDAIAVPIEALPRDADVMDLVYRRGETRWVREARAAGHRAADGREMLLWQGVRAFERWFARLPDVAVMRDALERAAARS